MPTAPLPPGPKGHFITGNLVEFSEDPLGFLTRCAREYGDVARLGQTNYLIAHPDLIERVFVNGEGHFVKFVTLARESQRSSGGFPEAMMNSEGEEWLRKRRRVQPAFHRKYVAACGEKVISLTERLLDTWRPGEPRDVCVDMSELSLDVVSRFLFNIPVNDEARHVAAAVDAIMRLTRSPFRFPAWMPTPNNVRLRRSLRQLDTVLDGIIRRYPRRSGEPEDLLGILLRSEPPLTGPQLRDELATMIMSGHETTADALVWTFVLLSQHPGIQERLVAELDEVLDGRPPSAEDLPRLRYTEAVVKESLRLYSPAWMTSREAIRDCELGGFHVPAGTTLGISQWVTHRDPRYYEEPEAFRPERWLSESIKQLPKYAWFPFGGGPRQCIGSSLAMLELVLMTACVVRRFRLELAPDCEVKPHPSLALQPVGVRIVPHPRGGASTRAA